MSFHNVRMRCKILCLLLEKSREMLYCTVEILKTRPKRPGDMVANKILTVRHLFRIKTTASCFKKCPLSSDFSCSIPNCQLTPRTYNILPNTLGFRVFFWFIEKIC